MLFVGVFFVFVQMSGILCDFYDLYAFSQIYGPGGKINKIRPTAEGI